MNLDPRIPAFYYGNTVDLDHLLFSTKRDFLVKHDGQTVKADELKGKTIVLIIFPLYEEDDFQVYWREDYRNPLSFKDVIDAYEELKPKGDVEFVSVPVYLNYKKCYVSPNPHSASKRPIYNHLLSILPWPALPFTAVVLCGGRVAEAFSLDVPFHTPYWVIIGPTSKVVASETSHPHLFKLFGGAELYPLSPERLYALWKEYDPWASCKGFPFLHSRCRARKRIVRKWDQLLASPPRDFLLSSNGDKVPISSLQDKVVGLYFCENIPNPPNMELIKKVYDEAKERHYAFEIVQINFHYQFFNACYTEWDGLDKEVHYENIKWLRLPFKDPSCRKLQRMLVCKFNEDYIWRGDCLVIIDSRKADEVLFEFSGAEIFREYGIQGYPFTRQSLFKAERERQAKVLRLESIFDEGCRFIRCDGSDSGDVSQLKGRRVLVLLGGCKSQCQPFLGATKCKAMFPKKDGCKSSESEDVCKSYKFVSMLRSKYLAQQRTGAQWNWFEVVYVSTDYTESSFNDSIKDMPWLVYPFSPEFGLSCQEKIFAFWIDTGAVVFGKDGGLVGKGFNFCFGWGKNDPDKFPFVSQDWGWVNGEVEVRCRFEKHHYHIDCCKKQKGKRKGKVAGQKEELCKGKGKGKGKGKEADKIELSYLQFKKRDKEEELSKGKVAGQKEELCKVKGKGKEADKIELSYLQFKKRDKEEELSKGKGEDADKKELGYLLFKRRDKKEELSKGKGKDADKKELSHRQDPRAIKLQVKPITCLHRSVQNLFQERWIADRSSTLETR